MNKLRVGIFIYGDSKATEGGSHSYYEMALQAINNYEFDKEIEIVNVFLHKKRPLGFNFKKSSIYINEGLTSKIKKQAEQKASVQRHFYWRYILSRLLLSFLKKRRNRIVEKQLKNNNIDLIYYLKPEPDILNYPFIATHWDVAHRSIPAFPEIALNNNYEQREKYYSYTLSKALAILCESKSGAEELKFYYPYLENKIKLFPCFAGSVVNENVSIKDQEEILETYKLQKESFFLYPAQFWSHKNHYHLVLAFAKLKAETKENLKLVLCGSDKGNLDYIKNVIESLSLSDSVVITGFVTTTELYSFYKNAIALVMPTFLGPTNLPLIEAAQLECAVVCSDFTGHKEILNTSAIYFNPSDSNDIKDAMTQVLVVDRRKALAIAAKKHVSESYFDVNSSLDTLNQILLDIIPIRKSWGIEY